MMKQGNDPVNRHLPGKIERQKDNILVINL